MTFLKHFSTFRPFWDYVCSRVLVFAGDVEMVFGMAGDIFSRFY